MMEDDDDDDDDDDVLLCRFDTCLVSLAFLCVCILLGNQSQ